MLPHQGEDLLQDGVHLQGHHAGGHVPGELQEALDDLLAAGGLLDDLFHLGPLGAGHVQVFQEEVGKHHDGPQGVIHFVGHPGGQLPQGGQLFGADEMLLQLFFVGDVTDVGLATG